MKFVHEQTERRQKKMDCHRRDHAVVGVGLGGAILGGKTGKERRRRETLATTLKPGPQRWCEHHGKTSDAQHEGRQRAVRMASTMKGRSKGPHGGKLFNEGDFGLEALLAEDGGEPRLRIWLYDGQALAASARQVQRHRFAFDRRSRRSISRPTRQSAESRDRAGAPCVRDQHHWHKRPMRLSGSASARKGKSRTQRCANQGGIHRHRHRRAASIKSACNLPGEIRLNEDQPHLACRPRFWRAWSKTCRPAGQTVRRDRCWRS